MNSRHDKDVFSWVSLVCERAGRPGLAPKIRVEWHAKMTSRVGEASWVASRIRLSPTVYVALDRSDRRDAVIQGAAHVVCGAVFGKRKQMRDQAWLRAVWLCGANVTCGPQGMGLR